MRRKTRILFFVLLIMLTSSLTMGGYEEVKSDKAKAKGDLYSQVELFADAIAILRSDYVDEVDSKKLIYGALKGMLGSLDDFSQFMEPDEFAEITLETKGEFGGIGVEISMKEGVLTVITPISGTPAEAAGLKPGDKIVRIDGKTTKDVTLADAVKQMRGKPGTTVRLTVWREKEEKALEIPVKRELIKIQSIKKADIVEDKIGYIKLVEFQERTPSDLEDALKKLESQGMDALILDLRNNPGGLLDGAVAVSEKFLPKDSLIVSIKSRDPKQDAVFKSSGKYARPDYPLIVMVNEGSASASEIVAGAIQDDKRGIILGTKTFGKASVQTVIPLKDGSALRFTIASYLTPSGKLIRNQGIIPDVVVEREEGAAKLKEETDVFEKVQESTKPQAAEKTDKEKLEKDNQFTMAVNLIKALKIYRQEKK